LGLLETNADGSGGTSAADPDAVHAAAIALAALSLLSDSHAAAGAEVALLTPANGATVVHSGELESAPTFGWRIDWRDAPAGGSVVIVLRTASDPALTLNAVENTFSCRVRDVNCATSFRPNRVYSGTCYWRVTVGGAVRAASETWSFTGVERGGGTTGLDRAKPRVRALSGTAQRGQTPFFAAKVGDDSGVARLRATLVRKGHEVARGAAAFRPVAWAHKVTLYSRRPLSRALARGAYTLCVTAWDRAGNAGRDCAPYTVR
jgi:hypothetical protein